MAFLDTCYAGQPGAAEVQCRADKGEVPRKAFYELARRLDAEVVDADHLSCRATPLVRAVARRAGLGSGQLCQVVLWRRAAVVSWSDRLAVLLALLFRWTGSPREVFLFSTWLSRPAKAFLVRRLGARSRLGVVVCPSSAQAEVAVRRLGIPAHQVHVIGWPVDERFWAPEPAAQEDMILAVGMEARDYATLVRAVRGLAVEVRLAIGTFNLQGTGGLAEEAAASSFRALRGTRAYRSYQAWMAAVDHDGLPDNVVVHHQVDPVELRALYARARLVVVPLEDVDCDCGGTSLTEAMAMGRAVVITRTRGQFDVLEDGVQGLYVPPGDPGRLRAAIVHLLSHPGEAARMGRAGRALVERRHSLDAYVERLAGLLGDWQQDRGGTARVTGSR